MEPLLPSSSRHELAELTVEVIGRSQALTQRVPSLISRQRIAALVHEMNSYYSNLIEGHKTFPKEIEQAMRDDFSDNSDKRANQFLSKAHIAVELLMRTRLEQEPDLRIQSAEFICWLHHEFYSRLPEELHFGERRDGTKYKIDIGQLRAFEVEVGGHQPPHYASLPDFMKRFDDFYDSNRILATNQLIALAAAHHRLAWIHPFGDGNGRVARLHSQAWLIRCKADGGGLWTISRGLARQKDEYYRHLSAADQGRLNDFDGRGNLSDKGLADFCLFFMRCMIDQIDFMASLLDLQTLIARMEAHLHLTYPQWSLKEREQIGRILKAALVDGEIDRTTATRVAGVSPATGTKLIRKALDAGLLSTPSPKGSLSLVFDSNVLESYFPKLYQDLPV
ncbi:Fic family protein [Prosthecobacter sp.]|jgi:Fic family protein|uniref:Fic family protein n=1 Tax=Prosthecobacter sp. TaxID=1965333 RepID=UPI0037851730